MYYLILVFLILKQINCFEDDKPIIEELIPSSKLIEGKKHYLSCNLGNGKGLNTFEWYFNGQKVVPNDNIVINNLEDKSLLNIKSMNLEYSGDYTCKVKNSFGFDSRTISIKLNVKPKWIVEPINIQAKLNSKFSTKCEANGIPRPQIKWIKLSSNGDEITIDSDELQFQNFTKSDASNYKCLAENELGKIEKTIKLTYYGNV